jgi:hypothetical protein
LKVLDSINVTHIEDKKTTFYIHTGFDRLQERKFSLVLPLGGFYNAIYSRQNRELVKSDPFFVHQLSIHPKQLSQPSEFATLKWFVENPSLEDSVEIFDDKNVLVRKWKGMKENSRKIRHSDFTKNGTFKIEYTAINDKIKLECSVFLLGEPAQDFLTSDEHPEKHSSHIDSSKGDVVPSEIEERKISPVEKTSEISPSHCFYCRQKFGFFTHRKVKSFRQFIFSRKFQHRCHLCSNFFCFSCLRHRVCCLCEKKQLGNL